MSGIVNCDYYYDAQYQIAWILKETNSEDTNFDVCYWLDSYLPVDKKVPRRIAMASYGILNDEEDAYGYPLFRAKKEITTCVSSSYS